MRQRVSSLLAGLLVALCAAACGSNDDPIESQTEQLQPEGATVKFSSYCVTSDSCLYGHCTTEDGACNPAPGCTLASNCDSACYGVCVAQPSRK